MKRTVSEALRPECLFNRVDTDPQIFLQLCTPSVLCGLDPLVGILVKNVIIVGKVSPKQNGKCPAVEFFCLGDQLVIDCFRSLITDNGD